MNLALDIYSANIKRILNTRGKAFKSINLDIDSLSREEIIQLLLTNSKLLRRSFLVFKEKKVILGFNEIEYTKQLM